MVELVVDEDVDVDIKKSIAKKIDEVLLLRYTTDTFGISPNSGSRKITMSHKLGTYITLILLAIQAALISFAFILYSQRTSGQFFGVLNNTPTFEVHALNRPNVSPKTLTNWATLAATATFTLDFVNYENQLNSVREYFTSAGYDNFLVALASAGTLASVTEKKLVLSAIPIAPSIISWEGLYYGNYAWQIQVPILVNYLSASANVRQAKVISLLITQVPTKEAPKGIGITQYISHDVGINDITG